VSANEPPGNFKALCDLMDGTCFRTNPYRGVLSKVGADLGYRGGRRSVFQAIKVHRTVHVMLAVAEAIRKVEESIPSYSQP